MKLALWQKLLVHLDSIEQAGIKKAEWPRALTQSGMATTFGTTRGSISLALSTLSSAGLVTCQAHKVENTDRQLLCYRLTDAGRKETEIIKAAAKARGVELRSLMGPNPEGSLDLSGMWMEINAIKERINSANARLERLENALHEMEVRE